MRWRPGWWALTTCALILATVVMLAYGWWISDTRELDWMRAEAARRGFDIARPRTEPPTRTAAWWDEVLRDLPRLKSFGRPSFLTGMPMSWSPTTLDAPLDPGLVALHATVADAAVDGVLDRLAPIVVDDLPPRRKLEAFDDLRQFLIERIAVAPQAQLPRLVACVARLAGRDAIYPQAVNQVVSWRIDDCRAAGVSGAPLIAMAQQVEDGFLAQQHAGLQREFDDFLDAQNDSLVSEQRVMRRYVRRALAVEWLAWIDVCAHRDLGAMAGFVRGPDGDWSWRRRDTVARFMVRWPVRFEIGRLAFASLNGRVLAAVLDGTPLPVDWFDPRGGPIRRHTLDPAREQLYSVGFDGIDDGGASSDLRFVSIPASGDR